MRKLTLRFSRWSMRLIRDGGGHSFADSGERPQKGTVKFVVPRPTLGASSLPEDLLDGALLLDYLKNSGVTGINGSRRNSGGLPLLDGVDTER
jgi:hypothetical protein